MAGWWQSGGDTAALILSTGVQTAAAVPILLSDLRHSGFDHLHQGICRPTRRLCSPTSAPTPKLSKKPKMQATGDTFPTDWSPPHIKFLTPRAPQAGRRVGTVGPQGLRRLACWVPVELEQKPQDSDPKEDLASLEELFRSTAGPSRQAAAPAGGARTVVSQWPPLLTTPLWPALLHHPQATPCPYPNCPSLTTSFGSTLLSRNLPQQRLGCPHPLFPLLFLAKGWLGGGAPCVVLQGFRSHGWDMALQKEGPWSRVRLVRHRDSG